MVHFHFSFSTISTSLIITKHFFYRYYSYMAFRTCSLLLKRSQFFGLFIVWSTTVGSIRSSGVGLIYNASFTVPYFDRAMNVSSCNECLCTMFSHSMNTSILSLNCIVENSNGIICELFSQTTTLTSNNSQIKMNLRSTFYFQLLPVDGQSGSTAVPLATTQEGAYFIFQ